MFVKISHNPYFTGNFLAIQYIDDIKETNHRSQSLFYWKLPCNNNVRFYSPKKDKVTILILLETSLQLLLSPLKIYCVVVTILILLETSLQFQITAVNVDVTTCHNPYFTGNFLAIKRVINKRCCYVWSQSLFYWKLPCN